MLQKEIENNTINHIMKGIIKVEDYLPAEWLSPMLDGSKAEGKFKTRKGLVAMKKSNIQVTNKDVYLIYELQNINS